MKKLLLLVPIILLIACHAPTPPENQQANQPQKSVSKPILVIHGGAGTITPDRYTKEEDSVYRITLSRALAIGYEILADSGTALQAVEATIRYMEDSPLFNAGKGSVYNSEGVVENDASIMDGTTLEAGAVAGIVGVKNPITLARLVKDSTKHVMLSGEGASIFADKMAMERVEQRYYFTDERWEHRENYLKENKFGTVGCVALDSYGNIAAGTSTGGMMHKQWGRIGDSPVIGAGTYADSRFAGVSCTGHGEYFIKNTVAYDIIAQMQYADLSLQEASKNIIHKKLKVQGAGGGLIALDKNGNVTMPFNTAGMFRGYWRAGDDQPFVALYPEEKD
jgi:beta-aspartyl-peptidase (threonine type)